MNHKMEFFSTLDASVIVVSSIVDVVTGWCCHRWASPLSRLVWAEPQQQRKQNRWKVNNFGSVRTFKASI